MLKEVEDMRIKVAGSFEKASDSNPIELKRRLGEAGCAIYGAPKLIERQPAALEETRYADCDWVGFTEDRLFFPAQKRWLDERLAKPPRLRATEVSILLEAVRAGTGLGLLPCILADGDPALRRLTPTIPEVTGKKHLLIHRDVLREPAVRATVDALAELFKRDRDLLMGRSASTAQAAE